MDVAPGFHSEGWIQLAIDRIRVKAYTQYMSTYSISAGIEQSRNALHRHTNACMDVPDAAGMGKYSLFMPSIGSGALFFFGGAARAGLYEKISFCGLSAI